MQILKAARLAAAVAAIATLGACSDISSIAGAIPGAAASAAPATTTTAPTITTTPPTATTATTTPATTTPTTSNGPEACSRTMGDTSTGTSVHGAFNGQRLPANWSTQLKSEAAVLDAIDDLYLNDWPCFQKFYPGSTTVYKQKRGVE